MTSNYYIDYFFLILILPDTDSLKVDWISFTHLRQKLEVKFNVKSCDCLGCNLHLPFCNVFEVFQHPGNHLITSQTFLSIVDNLTCLFYVIMIFYKRNLYSI